MTTTMTTINNAPVASSTFSDDKTAAHGRTGLTPAAKTPKEYAALLKEKDEQIAAARRELALARARRALELCEQRKGGVGGECKTEGVDFRPNVPAPAESESESKSDEVSAKSGDVSEKSDELSDDPSDLTAEELMLLDFESAVIVVDDPDVSDYEDAVDIDVDDADTDEDEEEYEDEDDFDEEEYEDEDDLDEYDGDISLVDRLSSFFFSSWLLW